MVEDTTMEEKMMVEGVAGISFCDCWRNGWLLFCDKFSNSFTSDMSLPIQYLPVPPMST